MAGLDRYGNPYFGKPRGRKPKPRFGKACLPSQLKWFRDNWGRRKEKLKARQKELDTLDPSRIVKRRQQNEAARERFQLKAFKREREKKNRR